MKIMKRNPVDINEKVVLFYDAIIKLTREYESLEERIMYLMRIVAQCDELIIAARKNGGRKLSLEKLIRSVPKLDENFIWLLDESKSGPEGISPLTAKESYKYYISIETIELLKKNIFDEIDGLNNLKTAFEIEIKKLGTALDTPGQYESGEISGGRIKLLSGISDIVRIFEAMKEADIISAHTNGMQIAELFFTDPESRISFDKKYAAIKSKLNRNSHASNSEPLIDFVKILAESAFGKKDHKIDEIIEYLEEVQRNKNRM